MRALKRAFDPANLTDSRDPSYAVITQDLGIPGHFDVAEDASTIRIDTGALVIQDGPRQVVESAATLAHLPQRTLTVTFLAGTASQTDTETGPTLAAVLAAAHILPGLNTWVAAVGDDGYVATVTPADSSFSISDISAAGSITTPLPMTDCLPGRRIPLGINLRMNFWSPMKTVCPAL